MKTALAISHVAFEDLGSLGDALRHAGFEIEVVDACTADWGEIHPLEADLAVVLGGPIGVYDQDCYPFLQAEIDLLRSRLAAKRPTLGICLGAQLMAAALGARVYRGSNGKELGWAPIQANTDSEAPPWLAPLLAPDVQVLHWHGDTFDLPAGAVRLAQTARYANQAFAVGSHALALQFHVEVKVEGLERWYVGHACELSQAGIDARQLRADGHAFGPLLESAARRFWRDWLTLHA